MSSAPSIPKDFLLGFPKSQESQQIAWRTHCAARSRYLRKDARPCSAPGNSATRLEPYRDLIKSTLNIKKLDITSEVPDIEEHVSIKPDFSRIGKRFQSKTPEVIQEITKHGKEIVKTIDEHGKYHLTSVYPAGSAILDKDDVKIERKLKSKKGNIDVVKYQDVFISLEK